MEQYSRAGFPGFRPAPGKVGERFLEGLQVQEKRFSGLPAVTVPEDCRHEPLP